MYKYKPTMTVLVKNCNDFLKSNPPTVIFFLSLLIITSATICFTLYVKNSSIVINSDDTQNWISLSKHLNTLNLCVVDSTDNMIEESTNEEVSFATLISINVATNATKVQAYYDLKDWEPLCGSNNRNSHLLGVTFAVTQNFTENENGTNICAMIRGPKEYLSRGSVDSCDFNEEIDEENTLTLIYPHSKYCSDNANQTIVNFSFKAISSETYLNQTDKKVVYVHLLWTSCILLFFVLIMLIYAMFYQSEASLKNYRLA